MSIDAQQRFDACMAQTLIWEGGYSDDAHDPGGKTMHGIIQREYDAYRARKGLAPQWVRLISAAEEDEIYRSSYWDEVNGDLLPAGVDLVTFDGGVNSGPSRGIKWLQIALGVVADGHMGEITMSALKAADPADVVRKAVAARREFLQALGTFRYFGQGWMTRCNGIEKTALAMVGADHSHIADVAPHDNADTQAATQGRAVPVPKSTGQAIAQSPSLRMQIGGALAALAAFFNDQLQHASAAVVSVFNLVPGIQGDVDSFMTPAERTAQALNIPWGKISLAVGLACVVFSIIRQTGQKKAAPQ